MLRHKFSKIAHKYEMQINGSLSQRKERDCWKKKIKHSSQSKVKNTSV